MNNERSRYERAKWGGRIAAGMLMWAFAATTVAATSASQLATSGTFTVSDAGSATYEIPLSLPPNTGGHTATLGLTYRSQDGNGLFGVGWSMSGLSAITRCPKSPAEEGIRQGVQNNWGDVYCLDGQKLRLKSGTYGGDGATYATARDSYARVSSHGAAGNGPQWFRVELKDGRVLDFGATPDSRLEVDSGNTVRVWMLSSARDRSSNGNAISYAYEKNVALGEQVLSNVRYINGSVDIEYEARPADDPIVRYDAGMQYGSTNRRAKTIRVYSAGLLESSKTDEPRYYKISNGQPVMRLFKAYRFSYTQSGATRRSLLTSVQECNGESALAVCLPALNLSYQNANAAALTLTARSAPAWTHLPPIDRKGNGKLEILSSAEETSQGGYWASYPFQLGAVWDFNSDGRMDVEGSFDTGWSTENMILLSDGRTLGGGGQISLSNRNYICRADMDGDGATDALRSSGEELDSWVGGGFVSRPVSMPQFPYFAGLTQHWCTPADFNGDGAAEAVVFWIDGEDGLSIYTFSPIEGTNGLQVAAFYHLENPLVGTGVMRLGDFNGDGKTDVVSLDPWAATLVTSNGRALFPTALPGISLGSNTYYKDRLVCAGDFNGDGRTDLYRFATGEFLLSTSTTFVRVPSGIPGSPGFEEISHCADFDGDGRAEIYFKTLGQIWGAATPGPIDYLSEVSTGLGQKTRVAYKPITDDTVYAKGLGSVYPVMDMQVPKYVVSRTLTSDGRGGFVPVSYTYEGLRADLRRNGTLGFSRITTLNEVSSVGVETTYRQDYPFVGLRSAVRKFRGSQTLEQTSFSYQAFDQTAQFARVHLSSTEAVKFDLNGSFVTRTRERLNNIDAFGNVGQRVLEQLNEAGTTVTSSETVNQSYLNDSTAWLIGLPTTATTARQVSSASIPAALGTSDNPPGPLPSPPTAPPRPITPGQLAAILQLLLSD